MIYGLYDDTKASGRVIKAEFEPVKAWSEIKSEYDPQAPLDRKAGQKSKPESPQTMKHHSFHQSTVLNPWKFSAAPKKRLKQHGFSVTWKSSDSKHRKMKL